MIGAEPRTQWLRDLVKLNDRGLILTGRDVPPGAWPLPGPPLPFETSLAGVFAAGNMRYGSVKRVAGAVGEGRLGQIPVSKSTRVCRWPVACPCREYRLR